MFAQDQLGAMLATGSDRIAQNEEGAVYWYAQAVKKGYRSSKWNLATMFLNGEGSLPKNFAMAKKLIESAANQGDYTACVFLSRCYTDGFCVKKIDEKLSDYWLSRANEFRDDNENSETINDPIDIEEHLSLKLQKPKVIITG